MSPLAIIRRPHTQLLPQHRRLLTSLLEYYTKTFTDAIMPLSTHTLNQGLTVITSLLYHCCNRLAFCQAWSLNEYVMLWSSKANRRSVFLRRQSGFRLAVTLTFDLLTPKSTQFVFVPNSAKVVNLVHIPQASR